MRLHVHSVLRTNTRYDWARASGTTPTALTKRFKNCSPIQPENEICVIRLRKAYGATGSV